MTEIAIGLGLVSLNRRLPNSLPGIRLCEAYPSLAIGVRFRPSEQCTLSGDLVGSRIALRERVPPFLAVKNLSHHYLVLLFFVEVD